MTPVRRWLRGFVVMLLATAAGTTLAADARRGRALYDGSVPLASAGATGSPARACVDCHRPSGMGNFEGGLAVPPIAGLMLFEPFDPDTAHFFSAAARLRVRPAYDEAALGRVLRSGIAPDGVVLHASMPRYKIGETDLADLAAHLRQLSVQLPDGIDAGSVRLATVTTPDADPTRRDAMLATLRRFVEQKNGQSRHEAQRLAQATRTREMLMYRKFRVWELEHWALQGEPGTWAAQLDAWQARRPVYALVGGIGRSEWRPVDAFCERHHLPCLLPLLDAGGGTVPGFYSLHFHAGIELDAALAARALRAQGMDMFSLHFAADSAVLAERVRDAFVRAGLRAPAANDGTHGTHVSLLAPSAHAAWLRAERPDGPVVWLPGARALGRAELDAAVALTGSGFVVSPMQTGDTLDRQLGRTRAWQRGQGMAGLPVDVVASGLQAATVLGEGLAHLDLGFTQAYMLELLEHGLENVIPWSPYPRLAIGPGQRIASKGSWVGAIHQGRIDWQWQAAP